MPGQQATMVRPTQERTMLGYLATTRRRALPLPLLCATGWRVPGDHTPPDTRVGTRTTRAAHHRGCSRRLDGGLCTCGLRINRPVSAVDESI